MVRIATMVNPGFFRSKRTPCLASCQTISTLGNAAIVRKSLLIAEVTPELRRGRQNDFVSPDKSHNRTLRTTRFHFSGNGVNQELQSAHHYVESAITANL